MRGRLVVIALFASLLIEMRMRRMVPPKHYRPMSCWNPARRRIRFL